MQSAFSTKHRFQSGKGETLLLQTDFTRSNTVIVRLIQRKDIFFPNQWILEGAIRLNPITPPKPNTQLRKIAKFQYGRVKLSFDRYPLSSSNYGGSSTQVS